MTFSQILARKQPHDVLVLYSAVVCRVDSELHGPHPAHNLEQNMWHSFSLLV